MKSGKRPEGVFGVPWPGLRVARGELESFLITVCDFRHDLLMLRPFLYVLSPVCWHFPPCCRCWTRNLAMTLAATSMTSCCTARRRAQGSP